MIEFAAVVLLCAVLVVGVILGTTYVIKRWRYTPPSPYLLSLHMVGGQTIILPCVTFEIVPPGMDEQGNATPMRLDYTPVDGWTKQVGFLDFRTVQAIDVERSDEAIAAEREAEVARARAAQLDD